MPVDAKRESGCPARQEHLVGPSFPDDDLDASDRTAMMPLEMLTPAEYAEQSRINRTVAFSRRLATLVHQEVLEIRSRSESTVTGRRGDLEALAVRHARQERCDEAMLRARGGLAEGCDGAMQRIADDAGDGRLPEWGPDADPWMHLQSAVELHAISLTLDDLLTERERRETRIPGL